MHKSICLLALSALYLSGNLQAGPDESADKECFNFGRSDEGESRTTKVYETDIFGNKDFLKPAKAIIETDSSGVSKVYDTDIFGNKDILKPARVIIETDSSGKSKIYGTDVFGNKDCLKPAEAITEPE